MVFACMSLFCETNEQAWAAADELIQYLDDATIAAAQKNSQKWTLSVSNVYCFVTADAKINWKFHRIYGIGLVRRCRHCFSGRS